MSLCTAITSGGPCLLQTPCRFHDDSGRPFAPLGGAEERTEDVGAPRSQREGNQPGAATAEPRPDNRFYREAASNDLVSIPRDDLRQLLSLLLFVHDSILRQPENDALLRRVRGAIGR